MCSGRASITILALKKLQLQGALCPLDPRGSFAPLTIYPGAAPVYVYLIEFFASNFMFLGYFCTENFTSNKCPSFDKFHALGAFIRIRLHYTQGSLLWRAFCGVNTPCFGWVRNWWQQFYIVYESPCLYVMWSGKTCWMLQNDILRNGLK